MSARATLVGVTLLGTTSLAHAAEVCFSSAGTHGALSVTESGPGCGTFLTYGPITNGLYMGNSNTTEACTFSFSPAVLGSTVNVKLTAHSCVAGACEEAEFSINGTHYVVAPADLDNTQPPGGSPLQITAAGDIVEAPGGSGDGYGTVTFNSAPGSTTSLTINHVVTLGEPNGTIYEVCADDSGTSAPTNTPTNTPASTNTPTASSTPTITNTPTIANTPDIVVPEIPTLSGSGLRLLLVLLLGAALVYVVKTRGES
ncbi:MAG TPA: hypothetical protein VNB06_17105 [Thermoanaerobaculia bacterium]|nr:hypothetical protein [Thermoanaerobaculia bacterium]